MLKSYKDWKRLFENEELKNVCKDVYDNVVSYMNEEDTSVGIYPLYEIDKNFIDDLVSEGDIEILSYDKTNLIMLVEKKYNIHIGLVEYNKGTIHHDSAWDIVNASMSILRHMKLKEFNK